MSEARRGEAFAEWWRRALADRKSGRAKALRARLRRADSDVAILAEPEVQSLAQRLGLAARRRADIRAFCTAARALAHVEEDMGGRAGSAARRFGAGAGEDRRVLSMLRFQHIVRAATAPEAGPGIIRALPMIGRACDVGQLGEDLFRWSEPVRNRWCFDYFEGAAAPEETHEEGANA